MRKAGVRRRRVGLARRRPDCRGGAAFVVVHDRVSRCLGVVPWRSGGGRSGASGGLLCRAGRGRPPPGLVPGHRPGRRRSLQPGGRSPEPRADEDAHRPRDARQGVRFVSRDRRRAAGNREADEGDRPTRPTRCSARRGCCASPAPRTSRWNSTRGSACRDIPAGGAADAIGASSLRHVGGSPPCPSRRGRAVCGMRAMAAAVGPN